MSTLKHFFGLGLIGLLSLNVYATDGDANSTSSSANEASLTKLNHNLVRLLDVNEMENPTGGVAILKYAEDHKIENVSELSVMGFENGYHGNSFATLSCSDPAVNLQ